MAENLYRYFIFSLISLSRPIKIAILFSLDLCVCIASIWLAFYLRTDIASLTYQNQAQITGVAIVFYILSAYIFSIYKELTRHLHGNLLLLLLKTFLLYGVTFFSCILFIQFEGVPRSIGLIQPILFFLLLLIQRLILKQILNISNSSSDNKKRNVLIYGAGIAGRQLRSAFSINKLFKVGAFIDDARDIQGRTIDGLKVYSPSKLNEVCFKFQINEVWLAIPSVNKGRRGEIISGLIGKGVKIRSIPDVKDLITGQSGLLNIQELDMEDLLGRAAVPPNKVLLERSILNKTVLVTGAGGSIGSEIVRQILLLKPKKIVLLDNSEFNLHQINEELKAKIESKSIKIYPVLCSVQDKVALEQIFSVHFPEIVFHAAAYKHVPLVEENISEAIKNNIFGTLNCAIISQKYKVSNFILVSTDKAVRPTSVMGATKRVAEMILQALNKDSENNKTTIFSMVRFGNVLDSSGSVVPLFRSQINRGGPITLTHKDVTRYFMTIPEAAQLVIQSASMAKGGDIFILDMGEPVLIKELAIRMINFSGLTLRNEIHPEGDIEIEITGLRPGEKLFEELLIGHAPHPTQHPKIMMANEDFIRWDLLEAHLLEISQKYSNYGDSDVKKIIMKLIQAKE